jgi:hypothetical protein
MAIFLQLAEAHNVRGEPRNEVDLGQRLVFTILALKQDCASPFDVGHEAITELDSSMNVGVELGERLTLPCHVVCGTGVKDLASTTAKLLVAKLYKLLIFIEVNFDQ